MTHRLQGLVLGALALLSLPILVALAQVNPQNMPSNTLYGRLGIGPGPGQAIPLTTIAQNLNGSLSVGSSVVGSGTNAALLYNNSGVLGNLSTLGTSYFANNSVTNSILSTAGAATLKGNPTGSAGANVQDFTLSGLTLKATPDGANDLLLLYDNSAGAFKKVTPNSIAAVNTAGVATLNGLSGALSIGAGSNISVTALGSAVTVAVTGTPTLSGNNTFSGVQKFSGASYFGNGQPWVDAKSGANSCAAAAGDGVTDDTTALQCQINYLNTTYGAGILHIGPATYLISAGGLIIKGGVHIVGDGPTSSIIKTNTDSKVITFDSATCSRWAALENVWVQGYQNSAATQDAVTVGANCPVLLRDNYIWGGKSGLTTAGVDGFYENNFICGASASGANVNSTGANWYVRDKLDTCGFTVSVGFSQGTACCSLGVAENHLVASDLSGSFTDSVAINDGGGTTAITIFSESIFSAPIVITNAKHTSIIGGELGSTMLSNAVGTLAVTGTFAFAATTATGAGTRSCSANINLTC